MANPTTEANGSLGHEMSTPNPASANQETPKPQRKRPQRPNYQLIHAKPLPLDVHPLPAFIPHSPLSLLRIATVILKQFFSPPSSHSDNPCIGIFSSETRSVHVTDPVHIRVLWEMGFFGKGTLSRSEPSWLDREKARLKARGGASTAEEATRKRREERKLFKLERARAEREQIEEQLRQEKAALEGEVKSSEGTQDPKLTHVFPWMQDAVAEESAHDTPEEESVAKEAESLTQPDEKDTKPRFQSEANDTEPTAPKETDSAIQTSQPVSEPEVPINQEHLQLTLEEAFFLSYSLGALNIISSTAPTPSPIPTSTLFTLFRQHSHFPPAPTSSLRPDDPFLLNYIVYHYYRSLGWVVRPGVKFSCDFLLYNRGPVFSHAEFALLIIPEYAEGTEEERTGKGKKDWWWLHCVNRVQSQVKKSLVVVYVQVPSELPVTGQGSVDIGAVLKSYTVREFVVRRWLANRSRD